MDNTSKLTTSSFGGQKTPGLVSTTEVEAGTGAQVSTSRVVLRWALVAAMAACIFYMSSRTAGQLGAGVLAQVKAQLNAWLATSFGLAGDPMSVVAHFCEYLVLGVLLVNALRSHMSLRRALVLAIVCASAYGVTDEIHQIFVDGRYCDAADWLTDTLGAALGASGLFGILVRRTK